MTRSTALSYLFGCLLASFALCAGAAGQKGLFSVPFFIENSLATSPPALRADFTLKRPAVLESFSMTCAGAPKGGLLLIDGGPLGINGATGVGADAQVGLVVGLISGLEIPVQIDFTVAANGAYFYPPTPIGIPVQSSYSFIVFPNTPNTVQCNGNAVFRGLG